MRIGGGRPFAVLGCRSDVLYLLSKHSGKVDLTEGDATNCLSIDIGDMRNVPQDVQLKGYGNYSPFTSPLKRYWTDHELVGIEKTYPRIGNSAIGSATTIDLMGDSRWVLNDDDSATSSFDVNSPLVKFSPGSSDVLMIYPNGIINIDIDTFGS